jgi:hypothetical protein
LLAGSAVFLAACSAKKHPRAKAAPPADQAAMTAAYQQEQTLIDAYQDALAQATPKLKARLEVELAVHQTHLSALKAFRPPVAATASPSTVHLTHLRSALRAAATAGRQAAVNAVDGANAALLASIAASHAISAAEPQ